LWVDGTDASAHLGLAVRVLGRGTQTATPGNHDRAASRRESSRRPAPEPSARAGSRWRGAGHGRRFEIVDPSDTRTLSRFLDADGSLVTIPSKHAKRLVVLDHLAQSFEIWVVYPEAEVNDRLGRFHPDVAALRRYLVEDHFLTRRDGFYWRSGGSVTIDAG
jgi:hypothetical protein